MVKNPSPNAGDKRDMGSIPGWGKSLGGRGNQLQYSCLENPMVRGAWWATVHGVAKSWTWLRRLSIKHNTDPSNKMCLNEIWEEEQGLLVPFFSLPAHLSLLSSPFWTVTPAILNPPAPILLWTWIFLDSLLESLLSLLLLFFLIPTTSF